MRALSLGVGIAAFALAVLPTGCLEEESAPAPASEPAVTVASSVDARAFMGDLRQRFEADDANAPALLPKAEANALFLEGDRIRPHFGPNIERGAESVVAKASGGFSTIRALATGEGRAPMSLSFRLPAAARREAVEADGYLVYAGALPAATLMSRVSSDAIEDYVYFERAPRAAEVRYDVELSDEVAGLRLVGNSLEALDEEGTPRLRVAPPFLVDADREHLDATLTVEGCAADTDPAGPWGRPVTAPGARRCTVVIGWDGNAAHYPAVLDPTWSTTGSMGTARAFHTATYLPSTNRILVAGGLTTGGGTTATCEIYNPSGSGTWSATQNLPTTGRAYHTAVTLNTGTVFVAGGMSNSTTTINATAIYTPSNGTWTSKTSMVTARARHAATVLTSGEVVVTGGIAGSTMISAVEAYRPTQNDWLQRTSTPTAATRRVSHSSVRMANGEVMVIGGRDGSTTLSTAYSYNFTTNSWTARGSLSTARVGHTATVLPSNDILVTGGGPFNSTTVLATCDLFKNATNTWAPTADMYSARTGHTATLVNGFVIVAGGIGPGSSALGITKAERFKPTYETWSEEPTLNTARANHAAAVTSAGLVVVAGGVDKSSSPAYRQSAEKLSPVLVPSFEAGYWADTAVSYSPGPQVNASDDPYFDSRVTEIKGTLYYPTLGTGVFPVIVMLHGNHNSCGQTSGAPRIDDDNSYAGSSGGVDGGGWCPGGHSEVRSDKGFAYVAHELAQRGYIVVSVNANRGIAGRDDGAPSAGQNIDTRGRLVLKTLQYAYQWNTVAGSSQNAGLPDLVGHLDLGSVGLMGHSRGGEGVRAAGRFYAEQSEWQAAIPSLFVRGIFEIGSTDEHDEIYDVGGVPWALLQGTCDTNAEYIIGSNRLSGLRTFDRRVNNATGFAGEYIVWGANHNFYNTEWQFSDVDFSATFPSGDSCQPAPLYQVGGIGSGITGSARQRQTAVHTIVNFMQAAVKGDQTGYSVFDSAVPAPPAIKVSRAHQMNEGGRITLENFAQPNGGSTSAPSLWGFTNTWSSSAGFLVEQASLGENSLLSGSHQNTLLVGRIKWTSSGSSRSYQVKWSSSGVGFDFTGQAFFEFRLDRDPADTSSPATDFGVRLLRVGGTSNTVAISSYTSLTGPPGIMTSDFNDNPYLSRPFAMGTVRIPMSAFTGAKNQVYGVEFIFNPNTSGQVYMANVRATTW